MTEIEKKASEYAERIHEELTWRPICGVEPRIAANAHRIGYIKGAEDVLCEKDEEVYFLKRKLKKWHYIAYDLVALSALLLLILIVMCA